MDNLFATLSGINVNDHVEKKNGLSYLSWAYAWSEFKKLCPDATYEIKKDESGRPYFGDPDFGYMVYTSVTTGGLTYEMWLPVMDNNNKSLMAKPYTVKTRRGEIKVEAMTMFDVNKAVMRCLVKNIAMFGLGLYIYAGEDIPEDDGQKRVSDEDIKALKKLVFKLCDGDTAQARDYFAENCKDAEDVEKYAFYVKAVTNALRMKENENGTVD